MQAEKTNLILHLLLKSAGVGCLGKKILKIWQMQRYPSLDRSSKLPATSRLWITRAGCCPEISLSRDKFLLKSENIDYQEFDQHFFFFSREILKNNDNHSLKSSVLHTYFCLGISKRETTENEACKQAKQVCLQCSVLERHGVFQGFQGSFRVSLALVQGSLYCRGTNCNKPGCFADVPESRIRAPDCRAVLLISLWSNAVQLCGEILECGLSSTHSSAICLKPKAIGRKTSYLATDH